MATKPTTTFTLATNTNYSVGPFAGSATKVVPADIPNGFTPGQGVQPELTPQIIAHKNQRTGFEMPGDNRSFPADKTRGSREQGSPGPQFFLVGVRRNTAPKFTRTPIKYARLEHSRGLMVCRGIGE
jgi:hypothetical protein